MIRPRKDVHESRESVLFAGTGEPPNNLCARMTGGDGGDLVDFGSADVGGGYQ